MRMKFAIHVLPRQVITARRGRFFLTVLLIVVDEFYGAGGR